MVLLTFTPFYLMRGLMTSPSKYLGGLTLLLNFHDTTSTAKPLIKSLKPWTNDLHIKERATWLDGEIDSLFNGYSLDSSSDDEEEDASEMDDNSSAEPLVVGNNEGEWSDDDKDDPDNEPTLAARTNSTTNSGGNTFSEKTGKYIPSGVLADTIREVGSTSTHVHK
ncbi:hypothetical protein Tco_1364458, partial [Tanacetum coccineum]